MTGQTSPSPGDPDETLAVSMLMDALRGLEAREAIRVLLSAQVERLTSELKAVRSTAYQAGYRKGLRDGQEGTVDPYNLDKDAPSWEELQRLRGYEPNPNYKTGWGPIPSENDYPGGRWPGNRK